MRRYHRSDTIIESFTVAIDSPPTDGKLTVSLSASETAAIPTGETITDAMSKYVYDIELVDGSGVVKRILDGYAYVSPEVTR